MDVDSAHLIHILAVEIAQKDGWPGYFSAAASRNGCLRGEGHAPSPQHIHHPRTRDPFRQGPALHSALLDEAMKRQNAIMDDSLADGSKMAIVTRNVAPDAQEQAPLTSLFPAVARHDDLYVTFTTTGGSLYGYASVVSVNGDAIFIPCQ